MSDTIEEPPTEEPVVDEPVVSEEPAEEPVVEEAPAEEAPVVEEEPAEEEPAPEPAEEPAPEPAEEPAPEPAEEPAEEEPVEEEPVVEPEPEPEPVVEPEPEPEPVVSLPMEQVASDIREILTTPVVESEPVSSEPVSSELSNVSLVTLIRVLGQWSGNEIKRRNVESELLSGSETDENLDNTEKMVEILKLWIQEGGSIFREHNYFKNISEYTLSGESRDLSEEKKVDILKTIVELTINVSHRRLTNEEIQNIMDSI